MILKDDPQTGGASDLIQYMGRDDHIVRDPSGCELDGDREQQFIDKSEENNFTRHFILAPDRSDLSQTELDRATRRTMTEFTEGRDTTQWVYSVHQEPDKDRPDIHVAATATKDSGDLWFETNDELAHLRDHVAADHFRDHATDRQIQIMREQGREDELRREQREKREQREHRQQRQQTHEHNRTR